MGLALSVLGCTKPVHCCDERESVTEISDPEGNKVRLKHAWTRHTERKAWTITTGSKACKKACKLFAIREQFLRGNASKMHGPLH